QIHINLFLRKLFSEQNYKIHDSESDLVSDIIEFISKYYMEDISLKKLSGRYGESINHLSYVFYKYTKIRPIDYLIKYRMAVATRLLEEGNSVKKVASAVGYNDEFYFSRLFKKHVGVVPSKIKNKNISVITEGENNEW
ncbi:helix-turn-helix domain-containing protein, partial [Clostridium neonatale]